MFPLCYRTETSPTFVSPLQNNQYFYDADSFNKVLKVCWQSAQEYGKKTFISDNANPDTETKRQLLKSRIKQAQRTTFAQSVSQANPQFLRRQIKCFGCSKK